MINVNSFYVSLYFYIVSYIMSLNIQLHFKIFITRRDKFFFKERNITKDKILSTPFAQRNRTLSSSKFCLL